MGAADQIDCPVAVPAEVTAGAREVRREVVVAAARTAQMNRQTLHPSPPRAKSGAPATPRTGKPNAFGRATAARGALSAAPSRRRQRLRRKGRIRTRDLSSRQLTRSAETCDFSGSSLSGIRAATPDAPRLAARAWACRWGRRIRRACRAWRRRLGRRAHLRADEPTRLRRTSRKAGLVITLSRHPRSRARGLPLSCASVLATACQPRLLWSSAQIFATIFVDHLHQVIELRMVIAWSRGMAGSSVS